MAAPPQRGSEPPSKTIQGNFPACHQDDPEHRHPPRARSAEPRLHNSPIAAHPVCALQAAMATCNGQEYAHQLRETTHQHFGAANNAKVAVLVTIGILVQVLVRSKSRPRARRQHGRRAHQPLPQAPSIKGAQFLRMRSKQEKFTQQSTRQGGVASRTIPRI